jgi:hypothetical protein
VPVVPVDRFLAYLTDIGRSPNTVKAYALLCRERHKKAYADPQVMPRWPGGSVPVVGRGRFERHNAAGQSPSRKVSRLSGAV